MAVAAGGFINGGNVSGGDCGGVGGDGFGGWQVMAVVGIVVCRTTMAMCSVHNNQPEGGRVAKIPVAEAKLQATTSRRGKRMR
jgi:hypothetical protein